MKVVRAEAAGACYGVQRALDMANEAANTRKDVKSLGPLIHNPQVVNDLEQRGVHVVSDPADATEGTVIIRSHGVGPAVRAALEDSAASIVDATCPHVLRAQKAASKLAEAQGAVIVVGDPEHPEVEAIREYAERAGGRVWVVDAVAAIPAELPSEVGVVVQTTQNRAVFDAVIAALQETDTHLVVKDTICTATSKRQNAAKELAKTVDAMVVIGGHNSSNTTRLYEICQSLCAKTYHVESIEELHKADFAECKTIGITAGASTPEEQIAAVEEYLERL